MKKRIYINRQIVERNRRFGERRRPISIRTSRSVRHAFSLEIAGPSRVIYSPDKPLACGATVWIETDAEVRIKETATKWFIGKIIYKVRGSP